MKKSESNCAITINVIASLLSLSTNGIKRISEINGVKFGITVMNLEKIIINTRGITTR